VRTFTVIYEIPGVWPWQFFECEASDGDHAESLCNAAHPNCPVLWVNEGQSKEMV
jgi:hypothetical protein